MKKEPVCSHTKTGPFATPCDGPMWEAPRYFADGTSAYRCERHAKWIMRANFAGPRYQPMKEKK